MVRTILMHICIALFVSECAALKCHECVMVNEEDTSCRDKPETSLPKDCGTFNNRCLTLTAQFKHKKLGNYVLRKCTHSTKCSSLKADFPETNNMAVENIQWGCCDTDNCNIKPAGSGSKVGTFSVALTFFAGILAGILGQYFL